jgi:uncharacterized Tic20 family protein
MVFQKNKSAFVDFHGKQVLNFQLSVLLYSILTALINSYFTCYYF